MKYKFFFSLLVGVTFLQLGWTYESNSNWEIDPDAWVHQKVNAKTGECFEKSTDLIVEGEERLKLERIYKPYQPLVLQVISQNMNYENGQEKDLEICTLELGSYCNGFKAPQELQPDVVAPLQVAKKLPHGNWAHCTYDPMYGLKQVEVKDSENEKTLMGLAFQYEIKGDAIDVCVLSSQVKQVVYHFEIYQDGFQLFSIQKAAEPPLNFVYLENEVRLQKTGKDIFAVEFDQDLRAVTLKEPFEDKLTALYRLAYYPSHTEVIDGLGGKTIYRFDHLDRLIKIEKLGQALQAQRIERKFWHASERGKSRLKGRTVEDSSGKILTYTLYNYDSSGNLLEESLYGNLTGRMDYFPEVNSEGTLLNPQDSECAKTRFQYDAKGRVKTYFRGNRDKIVYEYHPESMQLLNKRIYLDNQLVRRSFYTFDPQGRLVKFVEDNGSLEDGKGVESFIAEYHYKSLAEGGYEKTSLYKTYDAETESEKITYRSIDRYNGDGGIMRHENYDEEGQLTYCYDRRYDAQGQMIYEKDFWGAEYFLTYDESGNLTKLEVPQEQRMTTTEYNERGQPIRTIEVNEDRRFEYFYTYDLLGRQISWKSDKAEEAFYEYDAFGNIHKHTYTQKEEGSDEKKSFHYSYQFDLLGFETERVSREEGRVTQKNNVKGNPIKISYEDGSFESFEYDSEGFLIKHTDRQGVDERYTYDDLGRCLQE